MGNENVLDKIYLALELTKIKFNGTSNEKCIDICESFEYFVKGLTEIEDLSDIKKIKDENKTLHALYDDLKEKYNSKNVVSAESLDRIKTIINGSRGDMEPYVYENLCSQIEYELRNRL